MFDTSAAALTRERTLVLPHGEHRVPLLATMPPRSTPASEHRPDGSGRAQHPDR